MNDETIEVNALARSNACIVWNMFTEFDLNPTHVDHSVEGSLQISFKNGEKYADIECYNSGEILGIISDHSMDYTWDTNDIGLANSVLKIKEFILSDSF